jgi:hypothetical protein
MDVKHREEKKVGSGNLFSSEKSNKLPDKKSTCGAPTQEN